jgi:glycosyltransferase involved in cell wall biosynthesis
MNILWIVRGIKDYRIAVYNSLSRDNRITLNIIYNKNFTKNSVVDNLSQEIIKIPVSKELIFGPKDNNHNFANKTFRATYVPGMYKKIKSLRPKAIIIEGFFQYSLYAFVYKFFNRKTNIILSYERTKFTERNAQKLRTLYRKAMLSLTNSVVCNGSLSKNYLVDSLGFKKDIYLGNMTVDVDLINKKVITHKIKNLKKSDKVTFLYIGLLTKRKGLIELFNVWKNFEKLYKNKIELNIIGSGDLENFLKVYSQEKSLTTVNFLGKVNYDKIPYYLANSDILINPTLEDNWSLVVPEAMSAELPIITTIYNGLYPELVHGSNGWVIDILNEETTLTTLKDVIVNRNLLKNMGKISLKIINEFKPKIISKNFINAIEINKKANIN